MIILYIRLGLSSSHVTLDQLNAKHNLKYLTSPPRVSFQWIRLLGWLWLHEVGALASSLHQKAKAFLLGKTVVTLRGYALRTGFLYPHSENGTW
jgi:hypothetical protein